ncbi:dynamin family protein [Virgibacillus dakarensis]|uniref:dynamin family protein n=1 Tax=Virgibacillus dakarensis TaxID=1917889 RepID=UPI0013562EEF|nr:dynamin family protein [Virgibacillus dakarensis]
MELTTSPPQAGKEELTALYEVMLANGDQESATKILELYKKWKNDEFVVSFAGHFSAGKSTMINTLLGEDILPESPIPTSANVVKITSGLGVARIYFHDQAPMEYKEPYDMETIKDYCKDKDTIKKIELSTSGTIVPERTAIFDTPGIDAADDADRLITEASMHLVDLLVYVMDYNHVQSEVNLQFLHTLHEKRIPFYVVINQIDKHDKAEISFQMFENSVKQTFQQWNIIPEAIFYTSLIAENSAHNQFQQLKADLFSLMTDGRDESPSIAHSVQQIMDEHKHYLNHEFAAKMTSFPGQGGEEDDIYLHKQALEQQITDVEDSHWQLDEDFHHELQSTLNNAYLMPHELREKAAAFLEAQQDDFKVGLFSTKKKTAAEREVRLQTFLYALREMMEAAIQWKLRDKFTDLLKRYGVTDQGLLELAQQVSVDYTAENLIGLINPGAKVNGQAVLNYTNEVKQDIKQKYKRKALQLWEAIDKQAAKENNRKLADYQKKLAQLTNAIQQHEEIAKLKQTLRDKQKQLEDILHYPDRYATISLDQAVLEKNTRFEQRTLLKQAPDDNTQPLPEVRQQVIPHNDKTQSVDAVTESMGQTIETITLLPGFQSIIADLTRKRQQLLERSYTIALFGAFSAGKSSFANALIGENVLPVSPNPTTAAINRICPVTEGHPHGTVVVHMKTEDTLYADLFAITKHFSPAAADFTDLIQWVNTNNIQQSSELKQMHQSYLQAMLTGYQESKDAIGDQLVITMDGFQDYVSDETKACFVEAIDLYFDCELTRKGITLVDTPGADSVNSRHTNVAFDYIKYADAVFFVTYYNHALSRADKDFLMQLGRVKDAFQLDKMFFIVNACDLAKDDKELQLVTDYVESQLVQLGIRLPRIFPVSSKQALLAKQKQAAVDHHMQQFEREFYQFIHNDLAALSIQAALLDIKRAYQSITNYIVSASLNEQEKEQYRIQLFSKREMLEQAASEMDAGLYAEQIRQKLDKQLYYVMERFGIRFHDMFKEFFNPATITESGQQATQQLTKSLAELLDYAGYELVQELRAVSLRVEAFLKSLANDAYQGFKRKAEQIDEKLLLPKLGAVDLSTPEHEQAFTELDTGIFQKILGRFRGTKAFFVKNEKEKMKEELYQTLTPYAEDYMIENKEKMMSSYQKQWNDMMKQVQQDTLETIDKYIDDALSMLSETIDIDLLKAKQQELRAIMAEHGNEG